MPLNFVTMFLGFFYRSITRKATVLATVLLASLALSPCVTRANGAKVATILESGAPFPPAVVKVDDGREKFTFTLNDLITERRVIQDFEGNVDMNPWPASGKLAFSTEWKADGKRSVRIHGGTMFAFSQMATRNWTPYQVLRVHTFVPGDSAISVGIEITDPGKGYLNRHQNSITAPPGKGTMDIDISGDLWRGEVNRSYRLLKTPIDKRNIVRMAFSTSRGPDLYVDLIELLKVEEPSVKGGFAFDFARKGHLNQAMYIEINEGTVYRADRGYGFERAGAHWWGLGRSTPYPTPMMGNGLDFSDSPFQVDLVGGPYRGWVVFERSGFWEGEQSSYERARITMNGKTVGEHVSTRDAPFFKLQDMEVLNNDDVFEMIMKRQGALEFTFNAVNGRNAFHYNTVGRNQLPLRIAGMVLAPDTEEGRAYLKTHQNIQRAVLTDRHRIMVRSARAGAEVDFDRPIVARLLRTDHNMGPRERPAAGTSDEFPHMDAFTGMPMARLVGLYADKNPYNISAKASDLRGTGGAAIPSTAVDIKINNYMPMREYEQSACWIESLYYRPLEQARLAPDISRALLLIVTPPDDTPQGDYSGTVTVEAVRSDLNRKELTLTVPLTVKVHPGKLPAIPFPNSLFMSGLRVPKGLLGDGDYWRLTETLYAMLSSAGINFSTGGPDFAVKWDGERTVLQGADVVKAIRLAEKYDMARLITNYGGFSISGRNLPNHKELSLEQRSQAMARALEEFRAEHNLPEYLWYVYDEPGTDAEMKPVRSLLPAMRQAGLKTIGYTSMNNPKGANEKHLFLAKETTHPAFNLHSSETLQFVREQGNEPWVYNQGLNRWARGVHLWRNHREGAGGRIDWICFFIQGFQYDTLDSREPEKACLVEHKKYGVLPTPRFLGVLEGGVDGRMLFEIERRLKENPKVRGADEITKLFEDIEAVGYRSSMSWEDMESMRARMIRLLSESAR